MTQSLSFPGLAPGPGYGSLYDNGYGQVNPPTVTGYTQVIGAIGIASRASLGTVDLVLVGGVQAVGPIGFNSADTYTHGYTDSYGQLGIAHVFTIVMRCIGIASRLVFGDTTITGGLVANGWMLVPPAEVDTYPIEGQLKFSTTTQYTVFGDDTGLQSTINGNKDIPPGTKYVWYGGHVNITTDRAVRALWLANGYSVEDVSV